VHFKEGLTLPDDVADLQDDTQTAAGDRRKPQAGLNPICPGRAADRLSEMPLTGARRPEEEHVLALGDEVAVASS
jgi:hypothetical protein